MSLKLKKLGPKDIRALKLGAAAAVIIVLFSFGTNWIEHWAGVRKSLSEKQSALKALCPSQAQKAGLLSIVPAFEMPQNEEQQKFLFRDKLKEQISKAGIQSKPLQTLATKKFPGAAGYKMLRVKCSSEKCNFQQIIDLLASLKENPYLVGIEELKIKCDPKKRNEFELDMTVSTLVKSLEVIPKPSEGG